jgi:hypothetical protein
MPSEKKPTPAMSETFFKNKREKNFLKTKTHTHPHTHTQRRFFNGLVHRVFLGASLHDDSKNQNTTDIFPENSESTS